MSRAKARAGITVTNTAKKTDKQQVQKIDRGQKKTGPATDSRSVAASTSVNNKPAVKAQWKDTRIKKPAGK